MDFSKIVKKELLLLVVFLGSLFVLRLLKPILIGDFFDNQQFSVFFIILFSSSIIYHEEIKKIKNIKLFLLNELYHLIFVSIVFVFLVIAIKLIGDNSFGVTPIHLFGILLYSAIIIKISKIFSYFFKLWLFNNHSFFKYIKKIIFDFINNIIDLDVNIKNRYLEDEYLPKELKLYK